MSSSAVPSGPTAATTAATTVPFRIGKLFHIIHMSEELAPLDAFYEDLFFPRRGMLDHHFSPTGLRDASLLVIADAIIETMAPARVEGAEAKPAGRFFSRFGRHWHSLAWYVDDVGAVWDALQAAGIRTVADQAGEGERPTSGAVYTHARDTLAQLEFFQRPPEDPYGREGRVLPDPRLVPGWSDDWWADHHPLGLERLAYATVVTSDPEKGRRVLADVLGGQVIHEDECDLTETANLYISVGPETVVELARPLSGDSLAGRDLVACGDSCHAVAFRVRDLDAAERHLSAHGVRVTARDDRTLLCDPEDTFGAPLRFTSWTVPGDPRSS